MTNIQRLIEFSSMNNTCLTFNINNKGYTYQFLTKGEGEYSFKKANDGLRYYLSQVNQKIKKTYDEESVFAFARIINFGDNFHYLLTDASDKVYHVNYDNGWDPKAELLAESIIELIGKISWNKLEGEKYHFSFPKPIYRIRNLINTERIIEIEIHGFLIDQYESLLQKVFKEDENQITLDLFEYELMDSNNIEDEYYKVDISINKKKKQIKIIKSKWFDFDLPKVINPMLSDLKLNKTIHLLHEEDWDEKHGLCLLNEEEYKTLKKKRIVVEK